MIIILFPSFLPVKLAQYRVEIGTQPGPAPEGAWTLNVAAGAGFCPVGQIDDNENAPARATYHSSPGVQQIQICCLKWYIHLWIYCGQFPYWISYFLASFSLCSLLFADLGCSGHFSKSVHFKMSLKWMTDLLNGKKQDFFFWFCRCWVSPWMNLKSHNDNCIHISVFGYWKNIHN